MKFYNREKELDALEKAYLRTGADLIVVSGRRRIGKSRLIDEFTKEKTAINVLIVPKEEKQVAKDIEDEIRLKLGYSPPFSSFRDAVEYLFEHKAELICFDEFPNTIVVNEAIPYELQRLWDKSKEKKNLLLIISGSYVGLMNRLFTAKKAPLFNRATNTINLQPLPLKTIAQILNDLGVSVPSEQLSFSATTTKNNCTNTKRPRRFSSLRTTKLLLRLWRGPLLLHAFRKTRRPLIQKLNKLAFF